jgi:toxin ParE1/3/4
VTAPRYTVHWSGTAQADLQELLEFLAAASPAAALRLLLLVEQRAARLTTLPLRGRWVPELAAVQVREYRELVVPPYRLVYRVSGNAVHVMAFLDARRNLEDLLLDRLVRS